MSEQQDREVADIQQAWLAENRHKRRWMIVEEPDGYSVHAHTFESVAPPSLYPDKRKAVSRLSQLLNIGPVAPQTWPERACIGTAEIEDGTDASKGDGR